MKIAYLLLIAFSLTGISVNAQNYTPKIEACKCTIKVDSGVIAKCGYLVVPENRKKVNGQQIKIPFFYIRKADADSVKNISLYTTGGPGYSTIANFDRISANSGLLKYGGFIAFDQRGTKNSIPALAIPEIGEAIKKAYRENLSRSEQVLAAVKQSRVRLTKQGIDLSSYNTIESAADIKDLILALKIESITLVGISYSGGLMLTVAKNHPEHIKALVLNSPLPSFVNYEDHGLLNINESLNQIFNNCEADSSKAIYGNLREKFHHYFTGITGKSFQIKYTEKNNGKTYPITYHKQELLDAIIDRIDNTKLKSVPSVMLQLINGNHEPYVTEVLDGIFSDQLALTLGMRYSVYCSEQIAYSDPILLKKQEKILPWLEGYIFNNVDQQICDCWKVTPENKMAKAQLYSSIPVLISFGDADPWCRPFYGQQIKQTMPNAQLMIIHNSAHGSGYTVNGIDYLSVFMKNPYQKMISQSKDLKIE